MYTIQPCIWILCPCISYDWFRWGCGVV